MKNYLIAVWAILKKDLIQELKTFEIVLNTTLLAFLMVVLTAFAFDISAPKAAVQGAAGILWIAVSFCGVLAISRIFLREKELAVWTAVLMTPAPRSALYLGKTASVFLFLLAVELILLPILDLFFHVSFLSNIHRVLPILGLATLGYAAAGTLFGSMGIKTRLKEMLLGVILFPLAAPLLIAAVKATVTVISGQDMTATKDFIAIIVVFDVIFIIGGLWLFDVLMEE